MEFYPFPARIHSAYNAISEHGQATPAAVGDAIDFSAEFIPLLPLGTKATVEWVLAERTLVSFSGKVYLSSPQLVRIVDADTELVQAVRNLFAINVRLPAAIHTAPASRAKHNPPMMGVDIFYLSRDVITLHAPEAIPQGSTVWLDCEVDFLTLRRLELAVRRSVTLRRGDILLLCDVAPCSDENLIALSAYTAKLEHLP